MSTWFLFYNDPTTLDLSELAEILLASDYYLVEV